MVTKKQIDALEIQAAEKAAHFDELLKLGYQMGGEKCQKAQRDLRALLSRLATGRDLRAKAIEKLQRDPYKFREVRDIIDELECLKCDHPNAFELCINRDAMDQIIDIVQFEIYQIRDEIEGANRAQA